MQKITKDVETELLAFHNILVEKIPQFFAASFSGGDPRLFTPSLDDSEADDEDRATWVKAYIEADANNIPKVVGHILGDGMHVSINRFGFGTQIYINREDVITLHTYEDMLRKIGVEFDETKKYKVINMAEKTLLTICEDLKIEYKPTTNWKDILNSCIQGPLCFSTNVQLYRPSQ